MNTQQANRPVITPAMREQARQQPNSWLYVVDPIFTDPNAEVPPWGFIGGYRVDERGAITDDFSPNPNYRPSPVALRLPAPTNDAERALQLATTGYAQGQTLLLAMLEAELVLFAQPQGEGLVTMDHESGRRQLQVFTSEQYLPPNWTSWQRLTGRQLATHNLTGIDLQINPTNPVKARIPAEELVRAAHATQPAVTAGPGPNNGNALPAAQPAISGPTPTAATNDPASDSSTSGSATPDAPTPSSSTANGSTPPDATRSGTTTTAEPKADPPDHGEPVANTDVPAPVVSEFGQRLRGSILAGAIGDALGAPVEFYPIDQIRSRFGDAGVTDYDRGSDHPGAFTDDTQLTLFTLEGLVRAHIAERSGRAGNPLSAIQLAYQRWLHTQGYAWQRAAGPFAERHPEPTGWLIEHRELFVVRAPSSTCITALREFSSVGLPGTFDRAINESEDCGGVVRAAPVALWSAEPAEVFELAAGTAALTYSHPNGYLPAATHATIVQRLLHGEELPEALRQARELLARYRDHADTERALAAAVELAEQRTPTPERIRDTLGSGWAGHEALSIAVCAALASDSLADAVMLAINHSGDSDSTGAICGNIVGAQHGASAVPGVWLRDLRQREPVEQVVADALVEFDSEPPEEDVWYRRYPARHDIVELTFGSPLPLAERAETTAPADNVDPGEHVDNVEYPEHPEQDQVPEQDELPEPDQHPKKDETAEQNENPEKDELPEPDQNPRHVEEIGQAAGVSGVDVSRETSNTFRPLATDGLESRVLGFLLGGAVGDGLGYPVEDVGLPEIRRKYGESGVTDFVDAHRPGGSISDETQLTLFTLEGLIRASIRRRLFGETEPGTQVQHAYQRWLHTQGFDWRDARGPSSGDRPDGWLIQRKAMFMRRAPKTTCVQALHGYASGNQRGSFTHRVNESKGSGGVMRSAPAGLWSADPSEVCQVGAFTAVLTHGHPSGYLPAGALAVIVNQLLAERSLPEAVDRALTEVSTWDGHEETTSALRQGIELAASQTPTPELIEERLGGGEFGEQALAIAVCAALTHPESFPDAVLLAANHSGASDSTAAICGNIMGAARTAAAIPQAWRESLELRDIIEEIAHDALREFGTTPPNGHEWLHRYPVGDSDESDPPTTATPETTPDYAAGQLTSPGTTGGAHPAAEEAAASVPPATADATTTSATTVEPAPTATDRSAPATMYSATAGAAETGSALPDPAQASSAPSDAATNSPAPASEPSDASAEEDTVIAEHWAPITNAGHPASPADTFGTGTASTAEEPATHGASETVPEATDPGATAQHTSPQEGRVPEGDAPSDSNRGEVTTHEDGDADERLSEEELRLLATWRKFRDTGAGDSAELTHGLRKLLVEAFGQDRAAQLVGEESARQPAELATESPRQLDRWDRVSGCVFGGAVGDALGAPWMFANLRVILGDNPDGVRDVAEFCGRRGAASRYGQQTTFLVDGLIRAQFRSATRGAATHWPSMARLTLRHWLHTQGVPTYSEYSLGQLVEAEVLQQQRFPDEASLTALAQWADRGAPPTPSDPPNAARTTAATVRGAAAGLCASDPREAVSLGAELAAVTHGHPDGYLPAGALTGLIRALDDGHGLSAAVELVLGELDQREGAEVTTGALRSAVELARRNAVSPTALEELGAGWHASEALAIAVAAALTQPESFDEAVSLAATHAGNSAATAAICGSLLGTARGPAEIPESWLSTLEIREVLEQLVVDFHRVETEIDSDSAAPDWAQRYRFGE